MLLLAHENMEAAEASARHLQSLGGHARKLLAECVEHQGVTRKSASRAAHQLSDAGFVFLTEGPDHWLPEWSLKPSLAGEEALELLEQIEEAAQEQRKACVKK